MRFFSLVVFWFCFLCALVPFVLFNLAECASSECNERCALSVVMLSGGWVSQGAGGVNGAVDEVEKRSVNAEVRRKDK